MSALKDSFEPAHFRPKLSEAQLQLELLATVLAETRDEETKVWLEPQLEELEERLAALEQCRVVMAGARGCGKSTLWNALLALPSRQQNATARVRMLPTRPFGTCSAVPVELQTAVDGDPDAPFLLWFKVDGDFVRELNNAQGDAAVGQRLRAAMLFEGNRPTADFAEQCATLADVQAKLALHCALPVSDAADRRSFWPFLRLVRVTGPFSDSLVPAGIVLTDAPGDSDGNAAQSSACLEALHGASVVVQVFECNQFLQPATADALVRVLSLVDPGNLFVVVTKFLDTDADQSGAPLAVALLRDHFGESVAVDSARERLVTLLKERFCGMLKFAAAAAGDAAAISDSATVMSRIFFVNSLQYVTGMAGTATVADTGIIVLQEKLKERLMRRRQKELSDLLCDIKQIREAEAVGSTFDASLFDGLSARFQANLRMTEIAVRDAFSQWTAPSKDELVKWMFSSPDRPNYQTLGRSLMKGSLATIRSFMTGLFERLLRDFVWPDVHPDCTGESISLELSRSLRHRGGLFRERASQVLLESCSPLCKNADFKMEALLLTFEKLAPLVLRQVDASCDDIVRAVLVDIGRDGEAKISLHRKAAEAKAISLQKQAAENFKSVFAEKSAAVDFDPRPSPPSSPTASRTPAAPAVAHISAHDRTRVLERVSTAVASADRHVSALLRPLAANVPHANLSASTLFQTTKKNVAGKIYVMSNPAFRSNVTKIGLTTNTPMTRSLGLYTTGVPLPFVVEHECAVSHVALYERVIHNILRDVRYNERREFFVISVADAIRLVNIVCNVPFENN
jgi:energy-coupling factor transporter ATP-binding protein EcfA2